MTCAASLSSIRRLSQVADPKEGATQTLEEVFCDTACDAAGVGFVLSHLAQAGPVLWVQDRLSRKEAGRPYLPGLSHRGTVLRVDVSTCADALWAIEEGLRCTALGAVVGEIWGDPPALSFTATKRLAMRAELNATPCWLIRRGAAANLSAARNRWRVAAAPSVAHPHDPKAPGDPRWRVELFRSRNLKPGTWVATHDRAQDRVDLAAPVRDGALAEGEGASWHRAAR